MPAPDTSPIPGGALMNGIISKPQTGLSVLLAIDEKSYEGGKNGDDHPMAWYHDYDGGRAFYTALGHTDASYTTEENFLKHLLRADCNTPWENKNGWFAPVWQNFALQSISEQDEVFIFYTGLGTFSNC